MTINPENIAYHELVGLQAVIQESSDISLIGISGKVTSETRNMITIQSNSGRTLQVAKEAARRIEFETDSGVCFISGSSLIGKPEDRLARLH